MANMKIAISMHVKFALGVLLAALVILGGEYFLVKWYPKHQQHVADETLKKLPYRNDALGFEMEIAAGLYGRVESFPGGVKITRPKFWSLSPTLTITSQPNPDQAAEFSPQVLAKWQTDGTYQGIARYDFEHLKINNRDAVMIWHYKDRLMYVTARVISPDRIIEADCTPGREDEDLYLRACEESLRTLKVAGPEPPAPSDSSSEVMDLTAIQPKKKPAR
jgi:hypothetical protein